MSSSSESSESSDIEQEAIELIVGHIGKRYYSRCIPRQPYRNDSLSGREYVFNILNGHANRCLDMFRLQTNVLLGFCEVLKNHGLLRDTRHVKVEEQVCIFLYTIGHNDSNVVVSDRFQHSPETISRHFGNVLKAICKFAKEIIVPPDFTKVHPYLKRKGDKYWPLFKNCIGAIDGTHISASVAGKAQIPYRGRKSLPTQNVMCACDFDMCFTYVLAGWEGTANDSRVLMETINNPNRNFPLPPNGKYYLVDSGYANMAGFLAPYRGERYHRSDYIGENSAPRSAREQYNYAHSSLRNIIERCFGVLKARFPILKMMPSYSLRKQRNIVIVACAIHNYIRKHTLDDEIFEEYQDDDLIISEERNFESNQSSTGVDPTQGGRNDSNNKREQIRRSMAAYYHLPL